MAVDSVEAGTTTTTTTKAMETTIPVILIEIVLDRSTARDVLSGVLHAILFHRLFGTIKPNTIEVLDVTMPCVKDAQTEMLVDEKVDAFWKGVENGTNKRGQITVTFAEKRPKKTWFSMGEEEVPWEKWVIDAELRQPQGDRASFNASLSEKLTDTLMVILNHTTSETGRTAVPPITNSQGISPFPFKISVKVAGIELG